MNPSFEFPAVKQTDPSDVATALETARALWRRGDPQESLRWLRRAAESAEAEGDDLRAVTLARAAADLQEEFRPSALPPPPERASAPPSRAPSPPSARSAPPPSRPASAIPPAPKLEPYGGAREAPRAEARAADACLALRVAVEPKGSGTFVVRVLGPGEAAPTGSREALLVPTTPGVDLRAG